MSGRVGWGLCVSGSGAVCATSEPLAVISATARKRVNIRMTDSPTVRELTILEPPHELEPRPDVVHGAHLHVHEARAEADRAHHVLGEIGGDAGGPLAPGDPQTPVGRQGA